MTREMTRTLLSTQCNVNAKLDACFECTYITFLQNRSEHDRFLQTEANPKSKSQMTCTRRFGSTSAPPESLLQCHQNLDDASPLAQRLERLPHDCAQHPSAVRPLHRMPGC